MTKKELQRIILLLLAACFLFIYPARSQQVEGRHGDVKRLFRQGQSFLKKENYHQAVPFYEQVLALDANHVRALLYAGICKMHLHDNAKSLHYFQKVYQLYPEMNPFIHFLLGRAYHIHMQFDLAGIHYARYYETLNWLSGDKYEVQLLMSQARVGKKYFLEPTDFYAENLGASVNSAYSDHSAVLTGNRESMVFTSTRTENISTKERRKAGDAYEHTYTAKRFFDGSWGSPQLFTPLATGAGRTRHVSNSMFFNNDQKLVLYNSTKTGSLLYTEKTGDGWAKPKSLSKFTHTQQYESNACFSKDGKVFYFASSRGSRRGDLDLFYCQLAPDSTWSDPVAMPAYVNSTEDEDAPFLSEDGLTLYFSSKGHENMGGFDIFKTSFNTTVGRWSKPVNLGYPTNTPEDDIYFFTNDSTHVSYLSSNRTGGLGEEDIFNLRPLEEVMIRGLVTTLNPEVALPDVDVVFVSQKNKDLGAVTASGPNGIFGTRLRCRHAYHVYVYQHGILMHTETLDIPMTNRENKLVIKDFQLNVSAAQSAKPDSRLEINNRSLVKISYQEFDSLLVEGVITDEQSAPAQAQVRIRPEAAARYEASSVTDAQGRYRLAFIPGKRQNYVVEILKPGYPMKRVALVYVERNFQKIAEENRTKNVNRLSLHTQLTKAEPGKSFVLGGLYFENKANSWNKAGEAALNQLVALLEENPGMGIEVGAYTDSQGNLGENRFFAQRWAQMAVEYLVEKGIDKKRLVAKSYGEAHPVAPNDTELNGRDVNRRIVIKVLENTVDGKR